MFSCYEEFQEEIKKDGSLTPEQKELLRFQYGILFRYWKYWKNEDGSPITLENEQLMNSSALVPERSGENNIIIWKYSDDYKIKKIFSWSSDFYNADIDGEQEVKPIYYTDQITEKGSVIDTFFCGFFPMLDIRKYDVQMRAAEQLKSDPFHMVFDEVGTGKTVTALYCVRDVLNNRKAEARILIVCPNNKKNEWQLDIRRQLGLYAHVVENGNKSNVYSGSVKELYFRAGEPCILIEGQKEGQKNKDLDQWDENDQWDLVVIDEGHLCFNNYKSLKAKKALLLTATPIVINTTDGGTTIKKARLFNEYIDLLQRITNDSSFPSEKPNDLFAPNKCYTQLFREDLNIPPKKRYIEFVECERWEKREAYLDVLSDVIGGMTRLTYEQDDEYLIYGVFEGFREKIEEAGYLIGNKDDIQVENKKYEKLEELLNERNKSYIVFFTHIWPAENVYNKLKDCFSGTDITIGLKFGGDVAEIFPYDSGINKDNILDELQLRIRGGKKVIFLTTGASGGTGLNLGDFNGVIHYELPFTCIELEQRFGRVDRMDKQNSSEKEMVFLINKDSNPMLRYSTVKLHLTCLYMPIRNTVLFSPKYINANTNALRAELEKLTGVHENSVDSISNRYEELLKALRNLSPEGKKAACDIITHIIKKKSTEGLEELDSPELNSLYSFVSNENNININKIISFYKLYHDLPMLKEEIKRWFEIINCEITEDNVEENISFGETIKEDENAEDEILEETPYEDEAKKGKKVSDLDIDQMIEYYIQSLNQDIEDAENWLNKLKVCSFQQDNVSGLFFIRKDKGKYIYCRETVKEFRENLASFSEDK